jgi:hypothetical protein
MKTYKITYSFGQMDSTIQTTEITLNSRFTPDQVAAIFATRTDSRFLTIHNVDSCHE